MKKIGIWGDSITWGGYDQDMGGWASRLRRHRDGNFTYSEQYIGGPSVYNLGVWGNKVEDVYLRFESECKSRQTEIVILAIGINDSPHQSHPQGTPLVDFENSYRSLVTKARGMAETVLLVGPTNVFDAHPKNKGYRNKEIQAYATVIERLANSCKLQYVDLLGQLDDEDLSYDGVHPNATGHKKIFTKIKNSLHEATDE